MMDPLPKDKPFETAIRQNGSDIQQAIQRLHERIDAAREGLTTVYGELKQGIEAIQDDFDELTRESNETAARIESILQVAAGLSAQVTLESAQANSLATNVASQLAPISDNALLANSTVLDAFAIATTADNTAQGFTTFTNNLQNNIESAYGNALNRWTAINNTQNVIDYIQFVEYYFHTPKNPYDADPDT
jgi:methyl-accepting chemotaxis protein